MLGGGKVRGEGIRGQLGDEDICLYTSRRPFRASNSFRWSLKRRLIRKVVCIKK